MQFLGTFFFSDEETLQLLLAVFSCQITYGLICFLSNSINLILNKLKKISPTFFMSTRNDHVFDCLNEDLPESFFFKEVELLLLIVTLTQKKEWQ